MILDTAIILTWLATGYRGWVLLTQDRTIWRTSVAISMTATAVAFTLYRFRSPLDELTGTWNITGLLAHAVLTFGLAYLLIYLDALRMPNVPKQRIRIYLVSAGLAVFTMTAAWVVAPVHERPLDDLLPLARHLSVVIYCISFWVYLALTLALMAWTCLAEVLADLREPPERPIVIYVSDHLRRPLYEVSAGGGSAAQNVEPDAPTG